MRISHALAALALLLVHGGCGYVHFGRLPPAAPAGGDSLGTAYSDLATQHKILQQELLLARKEGDALRAALDSRTGNAPAELTARLTETTRELAILRASYAKLQTAHEAPPPTPDSANPEPAPELSELEEKLAASLRNYTVLQAENLRLRNEVDQTRTENTALAAQVKTVTAHDEQAQAALAQLNIELLAQKEARVRAEQRAAAASAQLAAVAAPAPAQDPSAPATLASARETAADSTATLRLAAAPPADNPSTAELHTSLARLRAVSETGRAPAASAAPPPVAPPAPALRSTPHTYVVQPGDTLEKIAQKYYGAPDRWQKIYLANNALLGGNRPLQAGMELELPGE